MLPFLRFNAIRLRWSVVVSLLFLAHWSQAQMSAQLEEPDSGSGITRVRKLEYNHSEMGGAQTGSFVYTNPCTEAGRPQQARRVLLTARFHANSIVKQGTEKIEVHNMGKNNVFTAKVQLQLSSDAGQGPYASPIALTISDKVPEQTFVLDLTKYFNSTILLQQATRLNANIVSGSYQPGSASYAGNFRLSITLEETYQFAPQTVTLPSAQRDIVRADGLLEQDLSWKTSCIGEDYQIQLLKLTTPEKNSTTTGTDKEKRDAENGLKGNEQLWRTRATTLDIQTRTNTWTTTLAEGYGTYFYRIRAIANAEGGVTNPENWGDWSVVGKIRLDKSTDPTQVDLSTMNWIYSRTFTEGGRVSEKITYANGLLQPRQTLTRLATAQQVIGLQTLQDYVGRDAVQSLPIPLIKQSSLTYRPFLLRQPGTTATAYSAADFDTDTKYNKPAAAEEVGYYSGTSQYLKDNPTAKDAPYNEGVADAQQYPFARTLFSRDGTNRVREQGSAGPTLSVGGGHTVRTAYASVAQEELTLLMGDEAPLADKTYKIVTTDPNNVNTVTYQTLDGKTVATALSGTGGSNLTPLPSATALRSVRERVTDKTDLNGIGTISRKILTLTEDRTIKCTYSITPNVFNDECGTWCRSCDYQLTVIAYQLDDPTQQRPVYAAGQPIQLPASCVGAKQTYPSVDIQLTAGTWVIEKKLTAYTANTLERLPQDQGFAGPVAGSGTVVDTPLGTRYIDAQESALRTRYNDFKTKGLWSSINAILQRPISESSQQTKQAQQAQKLQDLYRLLDSAPEVQKDKDPIDNQTLYLVPFGCGDDGLSLFLL